MKIITLDFETYYDQDFSLSKMQTDAYVLDPRFEVIGVGVKDGDAPAHWFTRLDIPKAFELIDWGDTAILCHNTLFDGFILTQKYGRKPRMWLDTLSMARAVVPYLPSYTLKNLAIHFGVGVKGTEVEDNKGMRLADFSPARLAAYGAYCRNDCEITYEIYKALENRFPLLEQILVDLHIRMFTEPAFALDLPRLEQYHTDIIAAKDQLLLSGSTDKDTIMSNPKFAAALEALGVDVPMKKSKTTNKITYAFAKTDKALTDLQEHPDSRVQALVAARLGVKTTIAETRAAMLIQTAQRGVGLPVYLNYWGAKTTGRASGGNKINCLVGETELAVLRNSTVLYIMLSALRDDDLVWDGREFVAHGGLVFQGYKEVITYECVTGTEDHKVFVVGREKPVGLAIAAEQGLVLQSGGYPEGVEPSPASMPSGKR